MGCMLALIVAVIGLLGSGAAGVWIGDLLKRRDNRTSVAADLAVWEKLPDGTVKSDLMASIERRVKQLASPRKRSMADYFRPIPMALYAIVLGILTYSFYVVSGTMRFQRHPDGYL
jgi:hypothetical protein